MPRQRQGVTQAIPHYSIVYIGHPYSSLRLGTSVIPIHSRIVAGPFADTNATRLVTSLVVWLCNEARNEAHIEACIAAVQAISSARQNGHYGGGGE